jgi:hypothetical protein
MQCILEEEWVQCISKDMSNMMLENESLCQLSEMLSWRCL